MGYGDNWYLSAVGTAISSAPLVLGVTVLTSIAMPYGNNFTNRVLAGALNGAAVGAVAEYTLNRNVHSPIEKAEVIAGNAMFGATFAFVMGPVW